MLGVYVKTKTNISRYIGYWISKLSNINLSIGLKKPVSIGLWQAYRDLNTDHAVNNTDYWSVTNFQEKNLVNVLRIVAY